MAVKGVEPTLVDPKRFETSHHSDTPPSPNHLKKEIPWIIFVIPSTNAFQEFTKPARDHEVISVLSKCQKYQKQLLFQEIIRPNFSVSSSFNNKTLRFCSFYVKPEVRFSNNEIRFSRSEFITVLSKSVIRPSGCSSGSTINSSTLLVGTRQVIIK